jgi:hypothetical protein
MMIIVGSGTLTQKMPWMSRWHLIVRLLSRVRIVGFDGANFQSRMDKTILRLFFLPVKRLKPVYQEFDPQCFPAQPSVHQSRPWDCFHASFEDK